MHDLGAGRSGFDDFDLRTVNTIRALAIDQVEAADSGHPGLPLGAAPMAYVLFARHLRFSPLEPDWPDRDRFVLSAGHGSALLYALLHVFGYDLPLAELRRFRSLGSRTPGHPERGLTPGVEVTTGPLGQGIGNAVGMALAAAHLAAGFNRPDCPVVTHRTYAICSDGDMMEGVSSEAASFAGHLRLPALTLLYDDNRISIEGSTGLAFTEDVTERFRAYGWEVLEVADGNDLGAIDRAITEAQGLAGPALIRVRTTIGYGSPLQGTAKVHGAALGAQGLAETKRFLGVPESPDFFVPPEVAALAERYRARGRQLAADWRAALARLDPAPRQDLLRRLGGAVGDLRPDLPAFPAGAKLATRSASGKTLQAVAARLPELVGGSADLASSNDTPLIGLGDIAPGAFGGRNIHFGVREHAMGAIMNGMAAHGGVRPYGGTFLVFSDYMRPSIRLAALTGLGVTYVFTHDSIGLGEDGPTHQPIEHLAALELIPNLHVVRPADANETRLAWAYALSAPDRPTALALSRQQLPVLEGVPEDAVELGAYVLKEPAQPPAVALVGSGSEVEIALAAAELLAADGVPARVVSAPCLKAFAARDAAARQSVLPEALPQVLVIAAEATHFLPFLGPRRAIVALDHFGASAPATTLYKEFGITPEAVRRKALSLL